MADIHHHGHGVVVEEDRSGPATLLAVLAVAALIGFFVWLFAFSGIVFDRGGSDGGDQITNNRIEQPAPPPQEPAPGSS